MKVSVIVTPRKEVLDPQGKAIEGALHRLGFRDAKEVRAGKFIEFEMAGSDRTQAGKRVEEMCKKLLSNPVIEDVRYEFAE